MARINSTKLYKENPLIFKLENKGNPKVWRGCREQNILVLIDSY